MPPGQPSLWEQIGEELPVVTGPVHPEPIVEVLAPTPSKPAPVEKQALAPGMRRPRAGEGWWVRHSVQKILPEGVPTYVREVVGIRTSGASVVIADLLLWDGAIGRLRISGYPAIDGCGYQWIDVGVPGTAFNWDETAKSWTRFPHP